MKKALAVLLVMSLGLGGCYWGPGGYHHDGYRGQGDRGESHERGR